MNYLKGLNWFLVAITFSGTVAADLIIDSTVIPGTEIASISIGPTSGNIFVTTINGYDVTPRDGEPPPPGDVAITSFVATPANILEGQSTSISWNTQNANTCTALGGTGGWASASVVLSGSQSITIATAGSYVFTLECTGDSGTVQSQLAVNVTEPTSIPENCEPSPLNGIIYEWAPFWNDVAFPQPIFANDYTDIPRNGYVAIKFNTAGHLDSGLLTTIEATTTSGRRLGSISECPGDFSEDLPNLCKKTWGVGGEIWWSTTGYSKACPLKPNTTYYFNVTFTDGVNPLSSECLNSKCITQIRAKNSK